jgi:hypothetical protein
LSLAWDLSAFAIECKITRPVTVFFEQGCATRVWSAGASGSSCIANAVANKRFLCATNLECGVAFVPEL